MQASTLRTLLFGGVFAAVLLFVLLLIAHFTGGAWITGVIVVFLIDIAFLTSLLFVPMGASSRGTRLDYPGDVHEVVDLEGIGPKYAKSLHSAGITNTQQLLFTPPSDVEKITGAPAKTIGRWYAMSQLIKVNGIGPQYAEVLARVDVAGIEDLAGRNAKQLVKTVNSYLNKLNSTVIGSRAGERRMGGWIKEAKGMERVPINLAELNVRALESKAAKAGARK